MQKKLIKIQCKAIRNIKASIIKYKFKNYISDMTLNEIIMMINSVQELYNKLVLIVWNNREQKNTFLDNIVERIDVNIVNVNKDLSKVLLTQTIRQRKLHLSSSMDKIIYPTGEITVLDNTEILFDIELGQDPLRLFESLSRNQTIIVFWNGQIKDGKLIYAEQGHPEYRSYDTKDLLVIEINKDKVEI